MRKQKKPQFEQTLFCVHFYHKGGFEKSIPPFYFVDGGIKEVAAMKRITYRHNPTIFELSKKARPPPGIFLPTSMNYQII